MAWIKPSRVRSFPARLRPSTMRLSSLGLRLFEDRRHGIGGSHYHHRDSSGRQYHVRTNRDWKFLRHTPAPKLAKGNPRLLVRIEKRNYERLAAAAAVAAAAFLAAFAAVEALRRRLVFGGVAGASPISSATMMLVTNNLGP